MDERVLVYGKLTLSEAEILELVPGAIVKGPAAQSDIISDVVQLDPTHLILIDGRFYQSLPVWHKELVYALLHPSLQGRVYGAASMGALRAADIAPFGMIGYGKVFNWFYESVTTDDSEVAVAYTMDESGYCHPTTVALVDVRATLEALDQEADEELLFLKAKRIHWSERTPDRVCREWAKEGFDHNKFVSQKRGDAVGLLRNFRELPVPGPQGIGPASLTHLFTAMYERERRVETKDGKSVVLEDIDSHVALTSPYGRRIFEDASNRAIAIMMCDSMQIGCNEDEKAKELAEFCILNSIRDTEALEEWKKRNLCSGSDLEILILQRARLKKLYRSLRTSRQQRMSTNDVLQYLRSCDRMDQFVREVSNLEVHPDDADIEETDNLSVSKLLKDQCDKHHIPLVANEAEFALDLGFGSTSELYVALQKYYSTG